MGELYRLRCDTCDYSREICDGCGMRGRYVNWYCAKCGTLKSQWIESLYDDHDEYPQQPSCGNHPREPMIELKVPDRSVMAEVPHTGVPCRRKCPGHLVAEFEGKWD